jgi:hypothetical protein
MMDEDFGTAPFLSVKFYKKPYGDTRQVEMANIEPEDIKFFQDNCILVSMEEVGNDFAVYACPASDEDEKTEILVLAMNRSCQETMKDLRKLCERTFL